MWPPIEAGAPKLLFGVPTIVWWGILTGCLIIFTLTVLIVVICCWWFPHRRQKNVVLTKKLAIESDTGLSTNSSGISSWLK